MVGWHLNSAVWTDLCALSAHWLTLEEAVCKVSGAPKGESIRKVVADHTHITHVISSSRRQAQDRNHGSPTDAIMATPPGLEGTAYPTETYIPCSHPRGKDRCVPAGTTFSAGLTHSGELQTHASLQAASHSSEPEALFQSGVCYISKAACKHSGHSSFQDSEFTWKDRILHHTARLFSGLSTILQDC